MGVGVLRGYADEVLRNNYRIQITGRGLALAASTALIIYASQGTFTSSVLRWRWLRNPPPPHEVCIGGLVEEGTAGGQGEAITFNVGRTAASIPVRQLPGYPAGPVWRR
jgi:hypothetical protein